VCTPIVNFLPQSISPIALIGVHFMLNAVVFNLVLLHKFLRIWTIWFQMIIMSLAIFALFEDHITGMFVVRYHNGNVHAKFLRRFLNSMQTPILLAVAFIANSPDPIYAGLAISMCCLVCLADALIAYHLRNVQPEVLAFPLRVRLFCAAYHVMTTVSCIWPRRYNSLPKSLPNLACCYMVFIAVPVLMRALQCFVHFAQWFPVAELAFQLGLLAVLYQAGLFTSLTYFLTATFLVHRIAGAYLMHAYIERPYRGRDRATYLWLFVFFWFTFACHPIPLNFLCNKLSFCTVTELSVQNVLPFVCCANLMRRTWREYSEKTEKYLLREKVAVIKAEY